MYREANLAARPRRNAKFPASLRQPLLPATPPNEVWSMDFVSDSLAYSRKRRCLIVADDFAHEAVDIAFDHGGSSAIKPSFPKRTTLRLV